MPDGYLNKTPLFQFILLSCLFPLWGCAAALNDILITQFKSVFSLSNFASALVQSAFYGGYFLIAIPASLVIKKTSYKVAILIGLTLYIGGCTLFFPASHMATYTMFLAAIFAIAIGLSFLETAANTYSSMIGPKAYATLRLNISQTFYPIGAASGILLGKYLVFSEGESLEKQMSGMNAEQIHNFKVLMLENTLEPYKYMIMILVVVMVLFLLTRFPTCKVAQTSHHKRPSAMDTLRYLARNPRFRRGIVAQFLYVGMQVAVWSFTIRLALELGDINERDASNFMVYSFACFFIGKFIANILMTRFNPEKVLILYSVIGASQLTIRDIFDTGIRPITMATDLLKPGGYLRLSACMRELEGSDAWELNHVDVERLNRLAADALTMEYTQKHWKPEERIEVAEDLPLTDCYVAPCVTACAIKQDIPEKSWVVSLLNPSLVLCQCQLDSRKSIRNHLF